jgi:hypothetical protein
MMAGTSLGFLSPFFTAFAPSEVVFGCIRAHIPLSSLNGAFTCCLSFHCSAVFFSLEGCGITAQAKSWRKDTKDQQFPMITTASDRHTSTVAIVSTVKQLSNRWQLFGARLDYAVWRK